MTKRASSLCCLALLALLVLDAGVLPTAAIRPGKDAMSSGSRRLLDLVMPNEGFTNTVQDLSDNTSNSSKAKRWSGTGRIAGVVQTTGGINNNGSVKKRQHNK